MPCPYAACLAGALYSYVGSTIVEGFGACLMVSVGFAAISCAVDFFLQEEIKLPGGLLGRRLAERLRRNALQLCHTILRAGRTGGF